MTEAAHDRSFSHLPPASASLAGAMARSRIIAVACIIVLSALGWIYLGVLVADMLAAGHGSGTGMDALGRAVLEALCRPSFGSTVPGGAALAPVDLALVLAMWCAMALAMMLPTAGPMILTYAEIADTAAQKGEPAVSPLVLAAGYLSVWLGFAVAAAGLQTALAAAGLLDPSMAAVSPLFSGAIFIGAGLYQFSSLKHACLTACQRPFPFLFANWTTRRAGIFRLGLRQGLYCLGCCWAMMLLMFAVGVMNVIWMAAIGLVMAAEKVVTTTRLSKALGGIFAAIGLAFVVTSVAAHWPGSG